MLAETVFYFPFETGVFNYILSWKVWKPISRLSYGAYLLHEVVIQVYVGNLSVLGYFNNWNQVTLKVQVKKKKCQYPKSVLILHDIKFWRVFFIIQLYDRKLL